MAARIKMLREQKLFIKRPRRRPRGCFTNTKSPEFSRACRRYRGACVSRRTEYQNAKALDSGFAPPRPIISRASRRRLVGKAGWRARVTAEVTRPPEFLAGGVEVVRPGGVKDLRLRGASCGEEPRDPHAHRGRLHGVADPSFGGGAVVDFA